MGMWCAQGGGAAGAGAAAGAGSEMDLATILATFPPDVREEVLLTSEEDVINSLPPALLAEAQQLRQRVMQHYRDNHASAGGRGVVFVGGPNSYARRGGTAGGRGAGAPGSGPGSSAYNLLRLQSEGAAALGTTDRAVEGPPQIEEEAVLLLTGLLKLAEAPARAQLQRVLLNLCAHPESRKQVMQILMSMLRAPLSADEAAEASQRDTQMDESEASTSQCLVPSPVRPGQEVLPHVSRRVLEYANHLARNRSEVARDMLRLRVPTPDQLARHTAALQDKKGKGRPMDWATEVSHEERALEVLIGMTAKTLCRRSNSHLEQALLLVEVSLGHANLHWGMLIEQHNARKAAAAEAKTAVEAAKQTEAKQAAEAASKAETEGKQQASGAAGAGSSGGDAAATQPAVGTSQPTGSADQSLGSSSAATPSTTAGAGATTAAGMPPAQDTTSSVPVASSSAQQVAAQAVIPDLNQQDNPGPVIQSLPEHLLKQLARLLGQSGLSELAQKRCASVIRMLVDTCPQLKPLMLSELQNELQRLSKLAGEELSELQARNFSSAGDISAHASGVRVLVLRVLKAAVSLTKAKGGKQDQAKEQVDEQDSAITAEMSQRLEPLWAALSATITQIEANLPAHTDTSSEAPSAAASILPPGAAQVLPLVEAFFVMCDARTLPQTQPSSPLQSAMSAEFPLGATPGPSTMEPALQQTPSSRQHAHGGASAPSQPIAEPHVPFLRFAEKHRRLLNTLLRQNASLLQGSLQPLLKVPRLIEFDNKRSYFRARIHSSGDDHRRYGGLRLAVRRSHVFEDSFHQMRMRSPDEMRMKLSVQFQGEEGIDAGGVSREWYQVMAREIFNPNFSLFVQVPEHGTTFQPNANSVVQNDEARGTNHLDFFKFVGRILGKALYDGQLIDAFFTRSFYKHMLGDPLTYEDIEAVDPEYYKNLRWMLENNITDVLDLTFTEESDYFGKKELVELKPGGKDMRVTEENKREYVNLVARHRMTTAIKPQINSFLEGFWDLVPKDLINMFNDHELELLISGLPEIDVDDLRANTEYTGYTPAAKQIQWFWELVSALSKEDLALLVQFVTGTSKVPLEGFKALQGISGPQKFQIHKSYGPQDRLPSAHTCFNQLDILEYESKEQLSNRLMVAIHEGSEGFGFG
ncbi:MAG: ubiquitin- UPL1 [Trebouxia sp. A1-2]|nr:MAG: ubiquitin- UPL1 [Trebouxia sp. A1-2]